jgi:hypothetical protein
VLLCSESAGEGLNLQFCNTLIDFDIPWNPMAIEQRVGRIDRGQTHEVFMCDLVTLARCCADRWCTWVPCLEQGGGWRLPRAAGRSSAWMQRLPVIRSSGDTRGCRGGANNWPGPRGGGNIDSPEENGGWYPHLHLQSLSSAAGESVRHDPDTLLDGYAFPAAHLDCLFADPAPLVGLP